MDHSRPVDRVKRGGDPDRERLQVGAGQRPLLAYGPRQVGSLDVLGDEVGDAVLDPGVEHGSGAEPGHPARRRDLAIEAPPEGRVAGQLRMNHLHGGQTPRRGRGEVHHAHAALAQLTPEHVAADHVHRSHLMPSNPRTPAFCTPKSSAPSSFPQGRFSYGDQPPNHPARRLQRGSASWAAGNETATARTPTGRSRRARRRAGVPGGLKEARDQCARAGRRPRSPDVGHDGRPGHRPAAARTTSALSSAPGTAATLPGPVPLTIDPGTLA